METALKNHEMELIRNKERLQFFKVLQKMKMLLFFHCWYEISDGGRVSRLDRFQTTHLFC